MSNRNLAPTPLELRNRHTLALPEQPCDSNGWNSGEVKLTLPAHEADLVSRGIVDEGGLD